MRRTAAIIILFSIFLQASFAQAPGTIKDGMKEVSELYGVFFAYDSKLPVDAPYAGQDLNGKSLKGCLQALFSHSGIEWKINGKYVLLTAVAPEKPLEAFAIIGEPGVQMDTIAPSVITADRMVVRDMSRLSSDVAGIRGVVSPLGEGDPIKWAQEMPGVTTGADGTTAFYVRGGNMGNNLFSLDGVPVYGYSHLLGLTTIVPQSVMKSASLRKGGFGGAENNFTAAHLCVTTKAPEEGIRTSVSLNNFLLSASNEGKVGKVSYIVSARISPLTVEYRAVKKSLPEILGGLDDFRAQVGDVYGKFRYDFGESRWLEASVMGSLDRYSFSRAANSSEKMGWTNAIGIARYHSGDSDAGFDVTATVNRYGSEQAQDKLYRGVENHLSLRSTLLETTLSADRSRKLGGWFTLDYGAKFRYAVFNPGQVASVSNRANTVLGNLYVQGNYSIPDKFELQFSARANYFRNLSNRGQSFDPEASLSFKWSLGRHLSLEGTFDRLVQYYHTLEGLPVGWSLDMLVPSGSTVKPESSLQGSLGFSLAAGDHKVSMGGFYKQMDNLVYYRYAQDLFSGGMASWEDDVDQGKGKSYGVEFLYEFQHGDWSGRLTYCWSRTNRYGFPNVNEEREFHARFDREHVLNAMAGWKGLNASFTLQSGHWENGAPENYRMHIISDAEWIASYYSGPNNFQMPMVLRLDLGYNFKFTTGGVRHDVNVGVCNVTNHFNPFMLYFDAQTESWKQLALLPILPNFSYKIEF